MAKHSIHREGITAVRSLAAALIVSWVCVICVSAPSDAQARLVDVESIVDPLIPIEGSSVSVEVFASGCPLGKTASVEAYLTASRTSSESAGLVARGEGRTTVLFSTRASLALPEAYSGTHGIRIACGDYVPPSGPMPNTTFFVGTEPDRTVTISQRDVAIGGTVPIIGSGCQGTSAEYSFAIERSTAGPFRPVGSIPVDSNGFWGEEITIPVSFTAGDVYVRTRCVMTNQYGETFYLPYADLPSTHVLAETASGTEVSTDNNDES